MRVLGKLLLVVGTLGLVLVLIFKNYNLSIYMDQIGTESTMNSKDKYIESLREAMLQRKQTVTLNFKGDSQDVHGFVGDAIIKPLKWMTLLTIWILIIFGIVIKEQKSL